MSRSILRLTTLSLLLGALGVAQDARAANDPPSVELDLDRFLKLHDELRDAQRKKPKPPGPVAPVLYAISVANYSGEVLLEGGAPVAAVFDARFRVDALQNEGWIRVPLLPATVALDSAKIGGKDATVVIEGGRYVLVTNRKGTIDVALRFGAEIKTEEGASLIDFELIRSGATTVELAVPTEHELEFEIANAKVKRSRVEGKRRVVEASLPATGHLSVQWQRGAVETAKQTPRIYAEVDTLASLAEGILTSQVTIHNTILFAGVDHFDFKVPTGNTVLSVDGPGIVDWAARDGDLKVRLNHEAKGGYELQVTMERVMGADASDIAVPILLQPGAERSKGWVGVATAGSLEVAGGEISGASPVGVRALPAAILGRTQQPVLLGYKYLGDAVQLPVKVTQHDDVDVLVTLLDETRARTMWTPEGRRLTSVKYRVRNNRRQFLRLQLPDAAELWSASVGGKSVQPAKGGDGRVMIPLVRSQSSGGALASFEVELVYVENGERATRRGRGRFDATLPRADAPSTYVAWQLYVPDGVRVLRRGYEGELRRVKHLSNPIPKEDLEYIATDTPQVQADAAQQLAPQNAVAGGATPVKVNLPLQGKRVNFEKLLALDEELRVSFRYRGLRE